MEKTMLTCPLTGVEFEALINEENILPFTKVYVNHPLEHYPIDLYVNEHYELCIPIKHFKHVEVVTPIDAAEMLGVSRQRIYQILIDDVIPSHIVNGNAVFKLSDILEYKENRTPGRPKQED